MVTLVSYIYNKQINSAKLTSEIAASLISIALDHIDTVGIEATIVFKSQLSEDDKVILDTLVEAHDPRVVEPTTFTLITKQALSTEHLLLFGIDGETNEDGYAEILFKTPGAFNGCNGYADTPANGRYVDKAQFRFENGLWGDKAIELSVIDRDNIFGAGPEFVLGSYFDADMPVENQFIPLIPNTISEIKIVKGPSFIPSGMWVRVKLQRAAPGVAKYSVCFYWSKNILR